MSNPRFRHIPGFVEAEPYTRPKVYTVGDGVTIHPDSPAADTWPVHVRYEYWVLSAETRSKLLAMSIIATTLSASRTISSP